MSAARRIAVDQPGAGRTGQRRPHLPEGALAHQFSRSRDRLTAPLDPGGRRASGWPPGRRPSGGSSASSSGQDPAWTDAIAGSRILARGPTRTATDGAVHCARRSAPTTSTTARASATHRPPTRCGARSGSPGATGSFSDIDAADAAIVIGANPTEGHPVVGARNQAGDIARAATGDDRPRRIELGRLRRAALSPRPGTRRGDARALPCGRPRGADRPRLIDARTEGFETARRSLLVAYLPPPRRGDHRLPGGGHRRRRPTSYGEAANASIMVGALA